MSSAAPRREPAAHLGSLAAPGVDSAEWIWRSGRLQPWGEATIHVNAVGHASVAAVFEGIKAYLAEDGENLLLFRLEDHLDRLYASARICRVEIPWTRDELTAAIVELMTANKASDDTYIRPWAFPEGVIREQMVPAGVRCEVAIDSWPFQSGFKREGCRAGVSSWLRISDAITPPRVKAFSNYHNGRLALMEARENGHDWPILLNDQHKVSEGPGACIAMVRDGVVVTPALSSGVLESVTRSTALTLLAEEGYEVEERTVDRTELYLADELFFLGTAWEVLPITTVDGLRVGKGVAGPVTEHLYELYFSLVRGRSGRHLGWLTPVPVKAHG
ncbi:branched-chain amino acid transaminase [Kitasatospora sp. NPDC059795]|uniref:branched-chain amino acid transaminase n=1 Tax=Kitasatospora sp. NPDC059795 TaxID=3346949 RepID=UPI00364E6352